MEVTIFVNDILQSCTYVLSTKNDAGVYLVDCGDSAAICSSLERNDKFVVGVILTHCHYDHIYGLSDILDKYPGLKVIAGEKTLAGIKDSDLNMSYLYTDDDYEVLLSEDQIIKADSNNNIRVFGEVLECLPTPGHDVDCMSYIIGDSIFTGDSYNPDSPVFTKWRNSNRELAIGNEAKLRQLIIERRLRVYPGHKFKV